MSTKIKVTYENRDYTLEYSRKTIQQMESKGVNAADLERKPMTTLPALFEGAFLLHHPNTPRKTVMEIFDRLTRKEELIERIAEMYSEPLQELVTEPENGGAEWSEM